jgi:hypothetical protein
MDFGVRSIERDPILQPIGNRNARKHKEGEPEFELALDVPAERRESEQRERGEAPAEDPAADSKVAPRLDDEAGSHLDVTA